MTVKFTIEGELSPPDLYEAKAAIERLLAEGTAVPIEEAAIASDSELAFRKAQLLRAWAGDASWHFMHTIAQCYEAGQGFTFDDLARTFSVNKDTVKSWHRSASKIMNKVDHELGPRPTFLEARWDGSRQHYSISTEMRDALIAAGV